MTPTGVMASSDLRDRSFRLIRTGRQVFVRPFSPTEQSQSAPSCVSGSAILPLRRGFCLTCGTHVDGVALRVFMNAPLFATGYSGLQTGDCATGANQLVEKMRLHILAIARNRNNFGNKEGSKCGNCWQDSR